MFDSHPHEERDDMKTNFKFSSAHLISTFKNDQTDNNFYSTQKKKM